MPLKYQIRGQPYRFMPRGHAIQAWTAPLALWGVAAGTAVVYLMSYTPIFRRDVLTKVPVLRGFYEDNTPDSDKPF